MTTAQILSLVRAKLLETSTDILSDETLLIYANLAYGDIIKKAFPNSAISTATVTFTSGSGTLPATFGTLYTDATDTNNNVFPEVSISDFVRKLANSENAVTIEGGSVKASPLSTSSLIIKFFPAFETLTASTNPTIDSYLHEPIIYGTISRALEDLQNPALSKFYENKFDTMLEKKINTLSNYEEDAMRGGVMFNGISIISGNNDADPNHF